MAEPTLRLTYSDLQLRVAEKIGVAYYGSAGDEAAQAPINTHDLDVVKRVVNDGWRRFYNSNPSWNWVLRPFDITFDTTAVTDRVVASTNWRYYMPDGFYGILVGHMSYPDNDGRLPLEPTTEQIIRSKHSIAQVSGWPIQYAVRPLADDPKRRWELLVWPEPSSNETITGVCRLYPNKMVEDTDVPNCGFQFDEAVLAACMAEAERQREDSSGLMESQWAEALVRAIAQDQMTAPATVGYNGDGSDGPGMGTRPWYQGVDNYYSGGVIDGSLIQINDA